MLSRLGEIGRCSGGTDVTSSWCNWRVDRLLYSSPHPSTYQFRARLIRFAAGLVLLFRSRLSAGGFSRALTGSVQFRSVMDRSLADWWWSSWWSWSRWRRRASLNWMWNRPFFCRSIECGFAFWFYEVFRCFFFRGIFFVIFYLVISIFK